jgi:hypothetical protein
LRRAVLRRSLRLRLARRQQGDLDARRGRGRGADVHLPGSGAQPRPTSDFNGPHGDIDIRRTNIRGLSGGAYQFWLSDKGGRWPSVKLDDVWIQPSPGRAFAKTIWPDSGTNAPSISGDRATFSRLPVSGSIRSGAPSRGDFVPARSGIGYRSPGYR